MKNKGLIITLIVILSVMALSLIGFMVGVITNGIDIENWGNIEVKENIKKEETFSLDKINQIEINLQSSDIKILKNETNEIRVVEYANYDIKENKLFQSRVDDNKLTINGDKISWHLFNFNRYRSFEIYLPEDKIEEFLLNSKSSDIKIEKEMNYKNLKLSTMSGNIITTKNISGAKVEISSISGNLVLRDVISTNSYHLKSTSGNIELNTLIGNGTTNSISGNINIGYLEGKIETYTTSGDICVNNYKVIQDGEIHSISGDIKLYLHEESSCDFVGKSLSGDIHNEFEKYRVGENPTNNLKVNTTSGGIHFKKA